MLVKVYTDGAARGNPDVRREQEEQQNEEKGEK